MIEITTPIALVCSYPCGEPGTDEFHFCSAPAVNGFHCAEHAADVMVRVLYEEEA